MTFPTKPSVLLLGASGALGAPVAEEFARNLSSFSNVGILTSPDRATKFEHLKPLGIQIILGSLFEPSIYTGFDTLVSMVGNNLMAAQPSIFAAAIQAGVTHIYPSEYNSDLSQPELRNMRYFRDKYAVRGFVEKGYEGVRFSYLETALFTEWLADEFHGIDAKKHTARAYGRGESEVTVTSIPESAAPFPHDSIPG